jgi:hypothetical protein
MNSRLLPFLLLAVTLAWPARAQFWDSLFNPEVQVTLTHPPGLGIKAVRVAFAPVNNTNAEDLVSACISDLAHTGEIEVLDRGNIEKVLNEQKFSNTGLVDEKTAVELGRLLGSPVLIFVKVMQANVKHVPLYSKQPADKKNPNGPQVTTYVSKTQYDFTASIQAVDLASGRVYSQQRIAAAPSKQNTSVLGPPEYPSENEVREMALDEARDRVRKMLLSWTEQRKLIFYDDKAYGMKEAYQKLKLNDAPGALQKSMEAVAAAKADPGGKPKFVGHANYNVGMCQFILGNYKAAMPFLKAARETDPKHSIYEKAEKECLEALKLEEAMSKVDAKSAKVVLEPSRAEPLRTAAADQPKAQAGNSAEDRLQKLELLKKKGLISPQEYEKKKAQIIDEI